MVSIPLTAFAAGYYRNGRGFQGVLHHPQAFGIVMALLGAWAIPSWLADRRPRWSLAASALAVVMVVLSGARTGGFALAIGRIRDAHRPLKGSLACADPVRSKGPCACYGG